MLLWEGLFSIFINLQCDQYISFKKYRVMLNVLLFNTQIFLFSVLSIGVCYIYIGTNLLPHLSYTTLLSHNDIYWTLLRLNVNFQEGEVLYGDSYVWSRTSRQQDLYNILSNINLNNLSSTDHETSFELEFCCSLPFLVLQRSNVGQERMKSDGNPEQNVVLLQLKQIV